jgi:uncharacterized repeat protein (TIGR03833 family)
MHVQRFRISIKLRISMKDVPSRDKISIGAVVQIVQKQDQRTGNLTEGNVKRILTSSQFHPHGIKVELEGGKIGRVQKIVK